MLKTTIGALSLVMITACSLVPAKATVFVYGARQHKSIIKTDKSTKSEASWEGRGSGRQLHLQCLKESLPGPNSLPECISRAAAVVDFTKDNQRGLQVTNFDFLYNKRQAGTLFKETTEPTVRVDYLEGFDTHSKNLPLKSNGWVQGFRHVQYDRSTLKDLGLDYLHVRILRIAVRATPKENKYVDEYASVEVKGFNYKVSNNDKVLKPDEDLAIRDGSSDQLINHD
jgi:hypothetical protein